MLVPAAVVLAVAITAVLARERGQDRERARRNGFEVVRLQSHTIARVLEMVTSILLYMSEESALVGFLSAPPGGGATERAALERDYMHFCRAAQMFGSVRLVDLDGRELLSIDALGEEPRVAERSAEVTEVRLAARGAELERDQVYLSAFDLVRGADGAPATPRRSVIRFAALAPDATGTPRALLVLDYFAVNVLRLVQQTGLRVEGWTALVDEGGHFLLGPSEPVSWTGPRRLEPAFAREHPAAWEAISASRLGTHLDDEGLYVWNRVQTPQHRAAALSELEATAVSHVPLSDLYARSRRTLELLLAAAAVAAVVLSAAAWRLAYGATLRAEHERRLSASEGGLRKLSARLFEAQEDERRRLSRDLHDQLGQEATAIAIGLKRAARSPDPAVREELLQAAIDATEGLLGGVHRIATSLRATILDDLGLAAALEAACAEARERADLPVQLELDLGAAEPPPEVARPEVARTVYRFVQEGLTNVLKHARASEVRVRVRRLGSPTGDGPARIEVEVRDDGVGFDPRSPTEDRLGLLGMRERVDLAGGAFRCESSPGGGTRLAATFPLDPEQPPDEHSD